MSRAIREPRLVRTDPMTAARILGMAVLAGMLVAIWFGLTEGDFLTESSDIWRLPWGRVTLVDLYLGFAMFGAWIAIREARVGSTVVWWVALLFLGNLAAGAYLTIATFRARDIPQLLLGHRAVD